MRVSLHRPLFCALPWAVKAGARAQATRGDTGAALSREAGTSPPPPFPRPSVSVRLWCRPDQAAAASTWPPPYLGCCPPPSTTLTTTSTSTSATSTSKAIICMWYSSISAPVTAYAPSRHCNCGGMSVHQILLSTYSPVSPSVVLPL
jgi:hypothetical protein